LRARRSERTTKPRTRVWSPARVAGGVLLLAWAVMFWFLFLTGRVNLYLSTKTSWVVPIGAVLLTAGGIGRLLAARGVKVDSMTSREAVGLGLMTVPVILVMVRPPATLGTCSG